MWVGMESEFTRDFGQAKYDPWSRAFDWRCLADS